MYLCCLLSGSRSGACADYRLLHVGLHVSVAVPVTVPMQRRRVEGALSRRRVAAICLALHGQGGESTCEEPL